MAIHKFVLLFVGIILLGSSAFAADFAVFDDSNTRVSSVGLSQTEMINEMKLIPSSCLQQARENGQATCNPLEGIVERIEFGFPIIMKTKNHSVSYVENDFVISSTFIESTNSWMFTVLFILMPLCAILFIHFINGREEISRKKLLIFDITIILSVVVSLLAGVLAAPFAGVFISVIAGGLVGVLAATFAGVFISGMVGGLVGVLAGWFAGGVAGGMAGGLVAVFYSTLTGAFAAYGYGFWECVDRVMIPEYLLFLVVTFIIGFIIREITFWHCKTKSTCNALE